jgi:UDP-2,3-diacylglucosamine pyrophosphatase LpxH
MNRWTLACLLSAASILAVGWPPRARVDRPRTGLPLADSVGSPRRLEATTSLPFLLPDEVRSAWVLRPGARTTWNWNRLSVELPAEAPKARQGTLRLVFAADLAPPHRVALLDQFIKEMEALKPDAVLFGGDLTYEETDGWYAQVRERMRRLEVAGIPVIVAAGNHERKGWPLFLRHFGHHPTHRVDLGGVCILTLDSAHGRDQLTPSQFRWLKAQLEDLDGRTPLIQFHHPVFPAGAAMLGEAGGSGGSLQGFQAAFVRLCVDKGVAAVLSGHWHSDAVFDREGRLRDDTADFAGPKYIVTTALGTELRQVTRWPKVRYGYRILEFANGKLLRYTHGADAQGHSNPVESTPLGLPTGLAEFPR